MDLNQIPFDELVKPVDGNVGKGTIEERFVRFHERMGMKAIYERVRWEFGIRTDSQPYKLNNDFCSLYARALMENEPALAGFFETRRRRAA